jgi:hypothetical protein
MFSGIAIILFGCYVGQMLAEYGSSSGSWPVFIGGLILIGLAIVFWLPLRSFESACKETDAKVTGRYTKEVSVPSPFEYGDPVDKEKRYWLVFQFNTENNLVLARAQVNKALYQRKRKGSLLAIRYSTHEPLILQIEGEF